MLVIRLRRIGKKRKPTYRVVVTEHTNPVNGTFIADLGFYNPHTKQTSLNKEEAVSWMKKGAQPSNTVAKIMEREKVKHGSVVVVKKSKKSRKAEEAPKPAAAVAPVANADAAPETTEEAVEPADSETPAEAVEQPAEEQAA